MGWLEKVVSCGFLLGFSLEIATGKAPEVSCPRDTLPYYDVDKIQTCIPDDPYACPQGYFCNYDGLDDRYICCGKPPGYCDAGKVLIDPSTQEPKECDSDHDECEFPYFCRSRNTGSSSGYCCLMVDEQEPPPIGCPWGTRPLKDANSQTLTCTPGKPGACPGTSICYYDSVEKTNKCCGRDPGEGCPSGNKAVKNGNQAVTCIPGDTTAQCPETAICQWSYLIDRYQCCEPDNGCPDGKKPILDSVGQFQACQKDSSTCGSGNSCDFNFWTASYQCCGQDAGVCPVNQVAYIDIASGVPRICSTSTVSACPNGYFCTSSTTNQNVCCGPVGQCPGSQTLVLDTQNRAQSCSPSVPNSCTSPAQCQAAVGGPPNQFLCCQFGTISQCPSGRTPYPSLNNPQQCSMTVPNPCPYPATCETTALPGLSICCSSGGASVGGCPSGWAPQNNLVTFCVPTNPTCNVGSSCLASSSVNGQYICCVPSGSSTTTYQCPSGTPLRIGSSYQFCNQAQPNCPVSSICQPTTNQPSIFICCTSTISTSTYTCSLGSPVLSNGQITFCSIASDTICPSLGAVCRSTVQIPTTSICCSNGASSFTCPIGTPVLTGTNFPQYCNTNAPNCPVGASCLNSPSVPNTSICCLTSGSSGTIYQCPGSLTPQRVGSSYQFCSPAASNCASRTTCQAAMNAGGIYICCIDSGSGSAQYFCPSNGTPYTVGQQYSFCSPSASSCPFGYSCVGSSNQPSVYICCGSSMGTTYTCPNNAAPYQTGTTIPTCTIGSPNCPGGYSCQQATNVINSYICCPSAGSNTVPTCPNNGQPQRVGLSYQYCSSNQPCQTPYTCQSATNLANTFVCCSTSSTSAYTCPINYTPYLLNGQSVFCNQQTPVSCPGGTYCLQAQNSPQYSICCNSVTQSNLCPNNQIPLLIGQSPQQCSGPGQSCPQTGYSCQVSPTLGSYICCGGSVATTRCQNNAVMYQPGGRMVYCTPGQNPSVCPSNYFCQQSTTRNTYVCCASSGTVTVGSTCISGSLPYQPSGSPISCTGNMAVCPSGSVCEQSNVPGQLICCTVRFSSSLSCPINWQAYLLSGNVPQTCIGVTDRSCPSGYSCTQANNAGSGQFLCCRFIGTTTRCYNSLTTPYTDASGNPRYCSQASPNCPGGYSCGASTIANTFICCSSTATNSNVRCQNGAAPYQLSNGNPQYCYSPGTSIGCPAGYTCQTSSTSSFSVCCNGFINNNGNTLNGPRCIGRATYMPFGSPITCTLPNTCNSGFECSAYTTTGQYICCTLVAQSEQQVCPDGAQPFKDPETKEFHYCSNTEYTCPDGYLCRKRINSIQAPDQYICCASEKPLCQRGWLPYLNPQTLKPQACSPFDQSPCNPPGRPYVCQQSTIPSKSICCIESLISMESDNKLDNKTVITKPVYPFDDYDFGDSYNPVDITVFTRQPSSMNMETTTTATDDQAYDYVWGDDGKVHSEPKENE